MIARMRDVAERAKVSVASVSIYLNNPEQVSAKTGARIQKAIGELGFVRNDAARQLRRGTSRMIAFIGFDVGDPFSYMVARGARRRAADVGMRLVLADTEGQASVEREYLTLFEEQRVRGVLLSSVNPPEGELADQSVVRVPLVMIDHRSSTGGFASVSVNNVLGGRLAAGHLLELGRKRIAFVGGPASIQQIDDRIRGAREAVQEHAGARFEYIETEQRDAESGGAVADAILSRDRRRRPDGVFCVNDTVALGMIQSFRAGGSVRVPDDIAVIGYNDVAAERAPAIPLSSIHQPRELFGSTAVDLLLEEVDESPHEGHRQVVFDPELVVRESTAGRGGGARAG